MATVQLNKCGICSKHTYINWQTK